MVDNSVQRTYQTMCWVLGCLLASPVGAADGWRGNAGVRATLNFTDNVTLSQVNPQSDVVAQVQPFVNYQWAGRISSARIVYGPQFAMYANNGDLNRTWQYLRATATAQVIEDYVGLIATARANPTVINQETGTAGFDTVANPDAYTQTASFYIAPTFRFPLRAKNYATVMFSPGLNLVASGDTAGGAGRTSTGGSSTTLAVRSGSYFYRMPWSVNYSGNVFDFSDSTGYSRLWSQVGYRFSERYRLDLLVGYDEQYTNSSSTDYGRNSGTGFRWQPRFYWTPSADMMLGIGVGKAPYGTDYYLDLKKRHKRFALGIKYSSSVQNARQAVLNQEVIPFEDAFGNPIPDPISSGLVSDVANTPTLVGDTYISDSLNAIAAFQGRRTSVSFNGSANRYTYQESGVRTTQSSGAVTVLHQLGRKLTANASFLYRTNAYTQSARQDYDQYRLILGVSYRLGAKTSAGVSFMSSQSSAGAGVAGIAGSPTGGAGLAGIGGISTGNYDENRLVLTFSSSL